MKVRYVASINRGAGVDAARTTLDLIKDLQSPLICGVELSGDPRSGRFSDYSQLLQEVR